MKPQEHHGLKYGSSPGTSSVDHIITIDEDFCLSPKGMRLVQWPTGGRLKYPLSNVGFQSYPAQKNSDGVIFTTVQMVYDQMDESFVKSCLGFEDALAVCKHGAGVFYEFAGGGKKVPSELSDRRSLPQTVFFLQARAKDVEGDICVLGLFWFKNRETGEEEVVQHWRKMKLAWDPSFVVAYHK